jgi:hypothetical protein
MDYQNIKEIELPKVQSEKKEAYHEKAEAQLREWTRGLMKLKKSPPKPFPDLRSRNKQIL